MPVLVDAIWAAGCGCLCASAPHSVHPCTLTNCGAAAYRASLISHRTSHPCLPFECAVWRCRAGGLQGGAGRDAAGAGGSPKWLALVSLSSGSCLTLFLPCAPPAPAVTTVPPCNRRPPVPARQRLLPPALLHAFFPCPRRPPRATPSRPYPPSARGRRSSCSSLAVAAAARSASGSGAGSGLRPLPR